MLTVTSVQRATDRQEFAASAFSIALAHDERHLRRRTITVEDNTKVLIDFPSPTVLNPGDLLLLSDGRSVTIGAVDEELYEITAKSLLHLIELAWHIGNRHLAAEIRTDRIIILRDHVLRTMLEGLGATVRDLTGPFSPTRGAYAGEGHTHHHGAPDAVEPHAHR